MWRLFFFAKLLGLLLFLLILSGNAFEFRTEMADSNLIEFLPIVIRASRFAAFDFED
jgi:cytochrome bd-type quinol oxidase subunit 2